jgi:stage III sporulation protein AG
VKRVEGKAMGEQHEKEKDAQAQAVKGKAGNLISSFKKLDTKKKIQYVAILLLVVIILTIYFSSFKGNATKDTPAEPTKETMQAEDLESKLEGILSSIEGAGRVVVCITYESTPEIVPAISENKQISSTTNAGEDGTSTINTESTQSDVVTLNGNSGGSALVLRENSPKVMGVIVVAEGADDIGVRLNLLEAVETVLNVSPDRVDVYKMNNE